MKLCWAPSLLALLALSPSASGSLIVAVPTKSGLIVVADKRSHNEKGYSDSAVKIWPAGSGCVVGVTGTIAVGLKICQEQGPCTFLEAWYLRELTDAYLAGMPNPDEAWEKYPEAIRQAIETFFRRLLEPPVPATPSEGSPLAVISILRALPPDRFRVQFVTLRYKMPRAWPEVSVTSEVVAYSVSEMASIQAAGSAELPQELMQGSDVRFNALRQHPWVRRFVGARFRPNSVSSSDALTFARFLIREASALTGLLNPDHGIGSTTDAYLIRFNGATDRITP